MTVQIVAFVTRECGNSAEEAFQRARDRAAVDYEGPWPSGTIADKQKCELTLVPPDSLKAYLETIGPENPAYYIHMGDGEYMFFGKAFKGNEK